MPGIYHCFLAMVAVYSNVTQHGCRGVGDDGLGRSDEGLQVGKFLFFPCSNQQLPFEISATVATNFGGSLPELNIVLCASLRELRLGWELPKLVGKEP